MRFFTIVALLLAIVAVALARPNKKPAYSFDARCYKLQTDENGEPTFETTEYTDCTPKGKLVCNNMTEVCCPKKTGGSKCVKAIDLAKFSQQI